MIAADSSGMAERTQRLGALKSELLSVLYRASNLALVHLSSSAPSGAAESRGTSGNSDDLPRSR
jgi:hypothetical protein